MWKKPVGLGAKRTRTCDIRWKSALCCGKTGSKKNRMEAVKDSQPDAPLDPRTFVDRFEEAARREGFSVVSFGDIDGIPLLACTRSGRTDARRFYLSSGIHGDEPAPALALLRLVEEGRLDPFHDWTLCPLLNPTGFALRQRENFSGIDLNRDYLRPRSAETSAHSRWLQQQAPFDLAICSHEDWEATGFYLYELNPDNLASPAADMIAAAVTHHPIETATLIDGREVAAPGIIRPTSDPLLRELWPEAIFLLHHGTRLVFTTETPSSLPIDLRISIHQTVTLTALQSMV